jgi:hypothetical protein
MTTECNQFVFGFHPLKRREIGAPIRITVGKVCISHEQLCAVPVRHPKTTFQRFCQPVVKCAPKQPRGREKLSH